MTTEASDLVREMLDECGSIVRAGLADHLRGREPRKHLYDLAADYPERGGRSLRSSLCIATARAFGASPHEAANSAVSLELLHNAFLVHDDVEDDSEERRGRPTLHLLHGVPVAVNVGDALAVMSIRPLIENRGTLGPRLALRILEEAENMARESVEGQAIELGWRRDNTVDLEDDDYLLMILKKTCWYTTIYPCRIGALIGTRDGVDLDRYTRFGFFLGAAFQIQDDLLNLIGDEARYGKEINGDIWEGKRTLMLIHLLRSAESDERAEIERFLRLTRGEKTAEQVQRVRERMLAHGCIEYAQAFAHGLAGAALHEHALAFGDLPDSRDRRFLEALALWVLERA
jgi:geranylgeranyl diphosphate synthase type II